MRTIEDIEADLMACTVQAGCGLWAGGVTAEMLYEELERTRDALKFGVTPQEEDEFKRIAND
jgi:hypothetical protein